jgi:hypothetical protein
MSKAADEDKYKRRDEIHLSYERKWRQRVQREREAILKAQENQDRRAAKAQKQREAAATAASNASKKAQPRTIPPPPVDPVKQRRREMLARMGLTIDSAIEIKKAWKRLALQYHPDKCGGQDTQFKSILEAYEFLMK